MIRRDARWMFLYVYIEAGDMCGQLAGVFFVIR